MRATFGACLIVALCGAVLVTTVNAAEPPTFAADNAPATSVPDIKAADIKAPATKGPDAATAPAVHHFGLWVADPAIATVNAREHFTSDWPLSVESTRPRQLKDHKTTASPFNLITFHGPPCPLEIDLRFPAGAIAAHWPQGTTKSNRLRWLDYQAAAEPSPDAVWATAADEHWFARARRLKDGLVLQKGARAERFAAFDFETPLPVPLQIEGGPDVYRLRSQAGYPLHDVVVVATTAAGKRIGWIDLLPAGKDKVPLGTDTQAASRPAEGTFSTVVTTQVFNGQVTIVQGNVVVNQTAELRPVEANPQPKAAAGQAVELTMSAPLVASEAEWKSQSEAALAERLGKTGLTAGEVELLASLAEPVLFGGNSLVVAWRLPPSVVDELLPLTTEPEATQTVRTVLVVARNLDPQIDADLQRWIDQLGSDQYTEREAAENHLAEMGGLAFPSLRRALTHRDPEVAFRAERLLLDQKQQLDAGTPAR